MDIKWSKEEAEKLSVTALGRNGEMKCCGIAVVSPWLNGTIAIEPINSKGATGRCRIEVPLSAVRQLAEALSLHAGAVEAPVYEYELHERNGECEYDYEFLIEGAKTEQEAWNTANEHARTFYDNDKGGRLIEWDEKLIGVPEGKCYEFDPSGIMVDVTYVVKTTRVGFIEGVLKRWTLRSADFSTESTQKREEEKK